jgi:DNA-directed RNA polymerase specialized sigma24 family protein
MTDPFDILAAEYRPMVLAYLRSMVRDAHLAQDLTIRLAG